LKKKEVREVDLHYRPLWDWSRDLIEDPYLAPAFQWDARRMYRLVDGVWRRFIDKPWTANRWWDVQVRISVSSWMYSSTMLSPDIV